MAGRQFPRRYLEISTSGVALPLGQDRAIQAAHDILSQARRQGLPWKSLLIERKRLARRISTVELLCTHRAVVKQHLPDRSLRFGGSPAILSDPSGIENLPLVFKHLLDKAGSRLRHQRGDENLPASPDHLSD